jgi:hydroxymethylpyrimidine/phosphomethylpyrimidine kinase
VLFLVLYRGNALTIAGSDSGGGAGIQADLKTFAALHVFGMSVITAVTAQNSLTVTDIFNLPEENVEAQLKAVLSDFTVNALKTGMLSRKEIIGVTCEALKNYQISNVVVDPVMISQSGVTLIAEEAVAAMQEQLLPLALLVTPNMPEAAKLSGIDVNTREDMGRAARIIAGLGPKAVLVKGGHMEEDEAGETVVDVLFNEGKITVFEDSRINTQNTHGTGCTLSAAIAAELAAGRDLLEAVSLGRQYLRLALSHSFKPGHGWGPLGHAVRPSWVVDSHDTE